MMVLIKNHYHLAHQAYKVKKVHIRKGGGNSMDSNVLFAFGLTIFAGLATGIGSAIAFLPKNKYKILVSGPWFLSWGGNDLCLFGGDICQSQCSSPSRAWYKTWLLGNDTFIFLEVLPL